MLVARKYFFAPSDSVALPPRSSSPSVPSFLPLLLLGRRCLRPVSVWPAQERFLGAPRAGALVLLQRARARVFFSLGGPLRLPVARSGASSQPTSSRWSSPSS